VVAPALYALRTAVASAREELVREATNSAGDAQREPLVAAAGRLADSVLRPLDAALGSPGRDAAVAEAPTLWDLARRATVLRSRPGALPELLEATAALQELACAFAATDGLPALDEMLAQLRELQAPLASDIRTAANGPYLVTNAERLRDWLRRELPVRPQVALCRCGASAVKP
jgi:hypothetical protein